MHLSFKKIIPNILTFLRLVAVPFTLYYILGDELTIAFGLFAFAAITDYVDGNLARRWQVETRFGRIFDPLADKALLMGAYIALTYTDHIPEWLMYLIVGRDILILSGALLVYLFNLPVRLSPFFISKVNTFFQLLLVTVVLVRDFSYYEVIPQESYQQLMWVLLYLTALTTALSGVEYVFYFMRKNLRVLLRRG
ncbi:MAG: CDP-alcohol phosphatidyltransferase family protein [Candidatus Paracaedibacteraceae bacterium]|nr:CDP-alcohol phosphatidyltransferase family protein [Candidatus Paracaedibacteraceae bacterium]